MKKLTNIFLYLTLITVISCDNFVEIEPDGSNADNYFNSEEEYLDALIGAYDLLQGTFWNTLTALVASDDYAAGGDPFNYDQPTLQNINLMIHTPDDENQLRDIWGLMYAGINRANYVLENKDKTDFAGKDGIIAEAYFLRAYFAFELVKFFGNVPLKTEELGGVLRISDARILAGDEFAMERVDDIPTAYELIAEDLKDAIPNLPAKQTLPYKATKGAAQALLGKLYLYHATYDNSKFAAAATELNKVIADGQYSLITGDDFVSMFEIGGENGTESVFEIQYSSVMAASWSNINGSNGNYFPKFNGPRSPYDDPVFDAGWGFCLPKVALYELYDAADARRDLTFYDLRNDQDRYSQGREDSGLFNKKYMPRAEPKRSGSDPLNYDNNIRAIRYADVLLMAAEAEAQSGGTNAEDYLNQVRARAYGDNSKDYQASEGALLEAIYTERRKELAGEGHRFFDLVRTKKAAANIEGFTENKNEIFPIPLIELKLVLAEERWGQNPGY